MRDPSVETAEAGGATRAMTRRYARAFKSKIDGKRCTCGEPAITFVGEQPLCAIDARWRDCSSGVNGCEASKPETEPRTRDMEQRIPGRDGTTTIIGDSYAPHGTITVGLPDRQEDPTQWKTKALTEAEVLKRRRWTPAQLSAAQAHLGFPQGEETNGTGFNFFGPTRRPTFYVKIVEQWEEHARACGLLK